MPKLLRNYNGEYYTVDHALGTVHFRNNGIIPYMKRHNLKEKDYLPTSWDKDLKSFQYFHANRALDTSKLSSLRLSSCPVCRQPVYYYSNDDGSKVYFDSVGKNNWAKHPCTDSPNASSREVEKPINFLYSKPKRFEDLYNSDVEVIHYGDFPIVGSMHSKKLDLPYLTILKKDQSKKQKINIIFLYQYNALNFIDYFSSYVLILSTRSKDSTLINCFYKFIKTYFPDFTNDFIGYVEAIAPFIIRKKRSKLVEGYEFLFKFSEAILRNKFYQLSNFQLEELQSSVTFIKYYDDSAYISSQDIHMIYRKYVRKSEISEDINYKFAEFIKSFFVDQMYTVIQAKYIAQELVAVLTKSAVDNLLLKRNTHRLKQINEFLHIYNPDLAFEFGKLMHENLPLYRGKKKKPFTFSEQRMAEILNDKTTSFYQSYIQPNSKAL